MNSEPTARFSSAVTVGLSRNRALKRAGEPRQDQTPGCSRYDEGEPEEKERDRLRRRRRIDELREEREEEQGHFRIQDIRQNSLAKSGRGAALFEMRRHRQLALAFDQRADAEKNQVGGAGELHERERPGGSSEERRETECGRAGVEDAADGNAQAEATPARRPCAMLRPRM